MGRVTSEKIKPQAVMLGFIADFYIKKKKLILEIDGAIHAQQEEYDRQRDAIFIQRGFNVLRISVDKVMGDPVGSVMHVLAYLAECVKPPPGKKMPRTALIKRLFS